MPEGKKVEDYNDWGFNGSDDRAEVSIKFEPKAGQVVEIKCSALNTGPGKQCAPLFGVRIDDTESSVLSKLGRPNHQEIDGPSKTIRYDDIGIDITLQKEHVYMLSSFAPKGDRNAVFRRYLKARLWPNL